MDTDYTRYHDAAGQICRAIDSLAAWQADQAPGLLAQEMHDLVGAWCTIAGKVAAREERNMRLRMAAADIHQAAMLG